MDNITHSLVGLVTAKAGLERLSPYATTVCVLAANAPDVDVLTRLRGPWSALQYHRGITHSIVGTLALGLVLPLIFFAIERAAARLWGIEPRIRLRGLLLASLVACATHPALDYLNNYGLRPLLPWSARWFYGDILYIADPWLWLLLGAAAFLLTARTRWRTLFWSALASILTAAILFIPQRLNMPFAFVVRIGWLVVVALVIWAHYKGMGRRYGARVAQVAIVLAVCYIGLLAVMHARAFAQAGATATAIARGHDETLLRVAAMPTLADPTGWVSVAETDRASYRFQTRVAAHDEATGLAPAARFAKPAGAAALAVARAEQDGRAQIFLGFARFPAIRVQAIDTADTLVRFADLRFTDPDQQRGPARGFSLDVIVPQH